MEYGEAYEDMVVVGLATAVVVEDAIVDGREGTAGAEEVVVVVVGAAIVGAAD